MIEISIPGGRYTVEYSGRGLGYETVYVDGKVAAQRFSSLWFVPSFTFRVGEYTAVLEVAVSPWLTISSLSLRIEGGLLYQED